MIRAVLDTNVLISALFWKGAPHKVVRKGIDSQYQLIISTDILDELVEKLKEKFDVPEDRASQFVDILMAYTEVLDVEEDLSVIEDDPDDDKILECAHESEADFIVSGDSHLLDEESYRDVDIVSPGDFLNLLN